VSGLPGIIESQASYREGSVVVQYDPAAVTPAEIADVIAAETYYTVGQPIAGGELGGGASQAAVGSTAVIEVEGMTNERIATLVTQAVGTAGAPILPPGTEPVIRDVSPDTAQSTLTVTYDSELVSAQELVDAIQEGTEFQASLISTASAGGDGGVDYTPYVVLSIAGLFVAALAWPGISWGRRQLARAAVPSRAQRRRARRDRRRR
jgi:copper chaperone CopZ